MPPPAIAATSAAHLVSPESLAAAGRAAERLSLPALQSKMKCDPEGYAAELLLLRRHFDSSLHLFRHHSALNPSSSASDHAVAKEVGDLAMFLAHVAPFYPDKLADFPSQVADLLRSDARSLPSSLRVHLAQALILLVNRKIAEHGDTLELFMDLQTLGDRTLRKLAFSHVVHSIRRMNQKHKNEPMNRKLQNILFSILQGEEELRAKRSLTVLCDLHRRKVWFDDRTANGICAACFHPSSRIMIAALSFLLGYEQVEEEDESEASSSEDDTAEPSQVILSREAVYKAHHKGTTASKKKKKAKLQRAVRSMKRQQKIASQNNSSNYYSPLTYLKDPQGFAEKLFSRLQKCNERFEVRMMMLKVISRTIGLHRLILLNFYPFLQRYVQPHQRDVTTLLAAAVQACHDMVPPDAVEPLFKQIVNQFVHDRSRTEAIAVGLNVVREICLRMPLLMNEDLLQDLVLYKKSHEKAVSTAARSLITLFREICPSLLVKKDRGRPIDPKARPKAFGEVNVASNVPGLELLQGHVDDDIDDDDEDEGSEGDQENDDDEVDEVEGDDHVRSEGEDEELTDGADGDGSYDDSGDDDDNDDDGEEEEEDDEDDEVVTKKVKEEPNINDHDNDDEDDDDDDDDDGDGDDDGGGGGEGTHPVSSDEEKVKEDELLRGEKRKLSDFIGQLNAADVSLRALKRVAGSQRARNLPNETDGILSNEDFQHIKELMFRM
ncbi:protein SDA1 homolog isoform X2 [Ananas comosus]|uniref:Protein SDA1 n=1 Tax=Ananas comosus TaxID=4615 RepID=A0A6P5G554_ANACO|nr:protein SDA1 homolog isoform X2 [Ananas comosus]